MSKVLFSMVPCCSCNVYFVQVETGSEPVSTWTVHLAGSCSFVVHLHFCLSTNICMCAFCEHAEHDAERGNPDHLMMSHYVIVIPQFSVKGHCYTVSVQVRIRTFYITLQNKYRNRCCPRTKECQIRQKFSV